MHRRMSHAAYLLGCAEHACFDMELQELSDSVILSLVRLSQNVHDLNAEPIVLVDSCLVS